MVGKRCQEYTVPKTSWRHGIYVGRLTSLEFQVWARVPAYAHLTLAQCA